MPNKYNKRDDQKATKQQHATMRWYGMMVACVQNLPPEDRASFDQWERERPEGKATSDWPGFAKYLPAPPWARGR